MRKFTFRLQKVLDHAAHTERVKQTELATARRALAEADRSLMRLVREREEILRRARPSAGHVNLTHLKASWAYAARLRRDLEDMKRVVRQLAADMRQKRVTLLEASKALALLERRREQKLAEHAEAVARDEQAIQDETATARHLRAV